MHEGHDASAGATYILDEAFLAKPRDYLLPVLVSRFEHAHFAGRHAVRALGGFCTRAVDLWLKDLGIFRIVTPRSSCGSCFFALTHKSRL
jgi:hypothetical protein